MPRKKPTRKDKRFEYKITIGRNIHGKPLRKSFYSTVSLSDAKKKAEEYRVASEVSARTGEAFVPSPAALLPGHESGCCPISSRLSKKIHTS